MNDKGPKVIKRYGNRKLYDTEQSRYVTLDEIAVMIKKGEDIQVVDNKSHDDLTSVTLTQIILEEEKRKKSLLPLSLLKDLIQQGGESIQEVLQRGIDSVTTFKGEAEKQVQKLISRGEITMEEGQVLLKDWFQSPQKSLDALQKRIDERIRERVQKVFGSSNLTDDVEGLGKRLKALEKKIKQLEKSKKKK
ncbi:polyhydroxyalkanoate synthesis regulator DNA-binding domain-containing protein [Thermodesulfobacteriota bacterium]